MTRWRRRIRKLSCQQAHDRPDFRYQLSGPGRTDGCCGQELILKEQIWKQDTVHEKRSVKLRKNFVAKPEFYGTAGPTLHSAKIHKPAGVAHYQVLS